MMVYRKWLPGDVWHKARERSDMRSMPSENAAKRLHHFGNSSRLTNMGERLEFFTEELDQL